MAMPWEAWAVLAVVAAVVVSMARNLASPDATLIGGLALCMTIGVFGTRLPDPAVFVSGFANPGVVTVGVLLVVAAGLTRTGATRRLVEPVMGRARSPRGAIHRMATPVAVMSAFLNNTAVVALTLPAMRDWCRRAGLPASKLLIPLSYAAILGGMCTLIGTSTNLVVYGLWVADHGPIDMGLFTIATLGVPAFVVGLFYLILLGPRLLPHRSPAIDLGDDPRQYVVEMTVDPGGPLAGKSVEAAGLRALPGLFLVEIDRDGDVIAAVSPDRELRGGDRLVFAGVVDSVIDLRQMAGLTPAEGQVFKLDAKDTQRALVEVVVSDACPLVGHSIREGRFRSRYQAAVIAVSRQGEQVRGKLGDVVLQVGDTLLLEAHRAFAAVQRHSRDFFLVSEIPGATPPRHGKAPLALLILAALVMLVGTGTLTMLHGALLAAGAMWLTRCLTTGEARDALDWPLPLALGAATGIGRAVEASGLAAGVTDAMLGVVGTHPVAALLGVYLLTNLFTEMITNTAAAVLVYPIAEATAVGVGADPLPFVLVVMIAASASFATPLGYQTNLMVLGPGGYRYGDYVKFGLPLTLLIAIVTVTVAATAWGLW